MDAPLATKEKRVGTCTISVGPIGVRDPSIGERRHFVCVVVRVADSWVAEITAKVRFAEMPPRAAPLDLVMLVGVQPPARLVEPRRCVNTARPRDATARDFVVHLQEGLGNVDLGNVFVEELLPCPAATGRYRQ